MAGHPEDDAQFATNATFVSPGDSWNGDPTKVRPPAGLREEGWEPTLVHPAGFENYLRNKVGEFVEYLRLIQVKNWRVRLAVASDKLFGIGYDTSSKVYVITGETGASTTRRSLNGGETFIAPTTPPLAIDMRDVKSDDASTWFALGDSASGSESADDGDTWTTRLISAGHQFDAVIFEPNAGAGGRWIAVGEDIGVEAAIFTAEAADLSTWTSRHVSGSTTDTFTRVAIDGSGKAVALQTLGVFAHTSDTTTWTSVSTGATTKLARDVAFSAALGLWMIVGNDTVSGKAFVSTSTDGSTFTEITGPGIPTGVIFNHLKNDGGSLWTVVDSGGAIWISTDSGVTWTELTAGTGIRTLENTAGLDLIERVEFFGRVFWALNDQGDVWSSLAL